MANWLFRNRNMTKQVIALVIGILISANTFAQSTSCACYVANADSVFPYVPLTQGTDVGYPPYYHCNNCSSQPIILPFSFCFYGKQYDTVYINNKGNLTFVHPEFRYSTSKFPLGNDTLMLAGYYTNVDDSPKIILPPRYNAVISYKLTPTHLIVQWSSVGYNVPDDDLYNNFQITITNGADSILPAGNNVAYCYQYMQWASGDSGTPGFNATPSIIGVNKGDHFHYAQFGTFDYRGYTYFGPKDTTSELYWLDNKSFIFNTCANANNIPPVIVKSDSCSIDTVCRGDTLTLSATFLCPQQGQKATLTVTSPGISGFINDTVSGYSLYHIRSQLVPALSDTGSHIITIIATDNGFPILKDSLQFKVYIKNCDTSLGVNKIVNGQGQFSIYPNPNNGIFAIISSNPELISGPQTIEVYNVLGEKVYSAFNIQHSALNIDLSNQPTGMYFYRVINMSGSLAGSGKFIIK